MLTWGPLYWGLAIRRYLRLPHAEGIAIASGTMALGVALLPTLIVPGMALSMFY